LLWQEKDTIPLAETFAEGRYRDWIETQCRNKLVWVVVEKNLIIGALVMQGNEVFYLVVSEDHRRKGVGRTLIKKAKAIYRTWGLTAKIAPGNAPVARLLANEGFQCNGVIPGVPGSITKNWIGYSWEAA
jgi:GNAT superfamily N-acetyltransferase